MTAKQRSDLFQTTVSIGLMVATGIVMLSSQFPFVRKIAEYNVHIMLGLLAFGLMAMVFRQHKIMFAGMACSAMMCIYLKDASNDTLKLPQANQETKLKVAHINLANITFDFEEISNMVAASDVDLISFQELTPDWSALLDEELSALYPHKKAEVRIDPYGMAVYSKIPFETKAVHMCEGKPFLEISLKKEETEFEVISSYLTPALDKNSISTATNQLQTIADHVANCPNPVIALGEYNMVYWTNEIREFRSASQLTNSRRGLSEGNLRVPYDHIFFCPKLECTEFRELRSQDQEYIGIQGTYQIKGKSLSMVSPTG